MNILLQLLIFITCYHIIVGFNRNPNVKIEVQSISQFTTSEFHESFKNTLKLSGIVLATAVCNSKIINAATGVQKVKKPKVLETDLGIKYIVLKKGSGNYPNAGDFVVIDFIGFLNNGTVFDSTETKVRKPLGFRFGKKQIIPGIESVLELMQPGGEVTCTIPPQYAYGSKGICLSEGNECIVPPNETLKYVIKLKSVGAGYS